MAGGVAEMSRQGAWIVPTFNEVPETDQPILAYWLMLISFRFFGINEFAARLPSSVFAVGTALLTYHLGRKLYSSAVGFLAGIIVCTCLVFSAFGRAATPDSAQVFFETLAVASYVWVVAWQRGGPISTACQDSRQRTPLPVADVQAASPENGAEVIRPVRPKLRLLARPRPHGSNWPHRCLSPWEWRLLPRDFSDSDFPVRRFFCFCWSHFAATT